MKTDSSRNGKILIGPSSFGAVDRAPLDRLQAAGFEVVPNPHGRKLAKEELLALLPGVSGLIAGLEALTEDVLKSSSLKAISRCGAGTSNVDLAAAKRLGIKVRHTPDAPTAAVAELTVGMMISLLRGVFQMDRELHAGKWSKAVGRQIEGTTVAIVGFGRIGRKVAELLKPFGPRIIAVDPALKSAEAGVETAGLDEALRQADVVTLHAAGERTILGEKEFGLIKPGAYLLNAARGGLIDEAALRRALDDKTVAGCWLDTFSREPYSGPLLKYPQAVLSPHIGSYSEECRRRMELEAVENLLEALKS